MDLAHYQREAWRYDQHPTCPEKGLVIALLPMLQKFGYLAGEVIGHVY